MQIRKNLRNSNFIVFDKRNDLLESAAKYLFKLLKSKRNPVIGLATGNTFEPFYHYISSNYKKFGCSFKNATTFNLDEYVGLSETDMNSYHYYMNAHLFSKIDINPSNTFLPDGSSKDLKTEVLSYEKLICENNGIDLQFLGIGTNGHIGFNEPGTNPASITHVVDLSESTITTNSKYFKNKNMPRRAITMGISTILSSKQIVLIATGNSKRNIINKLISGKITQEVPASFLIDHKNTTIMLDKSAGKDLI
jgi:glucosamine-6-phosphate deaminase